MRILLALLVAFAPGSVCLHPEEGSIHWMSNASMACPCHSSENEVPLGDTLLSPEDQHCACIDSHISSFYVSRNISGFAGLERHVECFAMPVSLSTLNFALIGDSELASIALFRTPVPPEQSKYVVLRI